MVAVITAGNFPVAVPSWYLVPALLCGNARGLEARRVRAGARRGVTSCSAHAGVPEGVLNLVQADGADDLRGLELALGDGRWSTRSASPAPSAVGARIGELCGRHLQTPCLELGGKNPLVVMPDADLDLAVEGALFAGFGTAGQRCTSLGTVIVHESVHDEFLARFSARGRGARRSATRCEDVLYGPMISERFLERFLGWLELIERPPRGAGSTATGPDHRATTRARGSSATRRTGSTATRRSSTG